MGTIQWRRLGGLALGLTTALVMLTSCVSAPPPGPTVATAQPTTTPQVAAFLRARWAEQLGDWPQAAQQYQFLANTAPVSMAEQERLFAWQLVAGDIPAAAKTATTLLTDPEAEHNLPRLTLVARAVQQGDLALAQKHLQAMPATLQTELLPYGLLSTYLQVALGQTPSAAAIETLRHWPTDIAFEAEKLYHVGRLWAAQGEMTNARQAWAQALALNPTHIGAMLAQTHALLAAGDKTQAAILAQTYALLKPKSGLFTGPAPTLVGLETSTAAHVAEVCYALATLMLGQGASLSGQQLLQLAWALAPQPHYAFYLGVLAEEQEDYTGAALWYGRVPTGHPLTVAAQVRVAVVTALQDDVTAARQQLQALIKAGAGTPLVLLTLAELAFEHDDFTGAVAAYTQLIKTAPEASPALRADWRFGRGAAYERLGQFAAARADLEAALAVAPDNATVLNYLGYMLVDRKLDVAQGKKLLAQAVALAPGNAAILDSMGWAHYRLGEYPAALQYLEKAATLEPNDPVITDHLADVYAKLGRQTEARTLWRRALRQNPTEPGLKKALEEKLQGR